MFGRPPRRVKSNQALYGAVAGKVLDAHQMKQRARPETLPSRADSYIRVCFRAVSDQRPHRERLYMPALLARSLR
jgi:hypothetical protein